MGSSSSGSLNLGEALGSSFLSDIWSSWDGDGLSFLKRGSSMGSYFDSGLAPDFGLGILGDICLPLDLDPGLEFLCLDSYLGFLTGNIFPLGGL